MKLPHGLELKLEDLKLEIEVDGLDKTLNRLLKNIYDLEWLVFRQQKEILRFRDREIEISNTPKFKYPS